MTTETLKDVLANQVGNVVQSFVDDGAIKIEVTKTSKGTWDIKATKL